MADLFPSFKLAKQNYSLESRVYIKGIQHIEACFWKYIPFQFINPSHDTIHVISQFKKKKGKKQPEFPNTCHKIFRKNERSVFNVLNKSNKCSESTQRGKKKKCSALRSLWHSGCWITHRGAGEGRQMRKFRNMEPLRSQWCHSSSHWVHQWYSSHTHWSRGELDTELQKAYREWVREDKVPHSNGLKLRPFWSRTLTFKFSSHLTFCCHWVILRSQSTEHKLAE